jgi:SAM-dependent methyltransferase
MHTGIIGGRLGTAVLQRIGDRAARGEVCSGRAYDGRSKLQAIFGAPVWDAVRGRTVIDFGCGAGKECVEMARHGARRVIGLDTSPKALEVARRHAADAGVSDRCEFVTDTSEVADVVFSLDGFEHYGDPAGVLAWMRAHVSAAGQVHIAFGPPWRHPLGGHLFSVFPWAHLVFTERALLQWRASFKDDGATRFSEVAGGLNQMTIRRFEQLLRASDFDVQLFECRPIRGAERLSTRATREFFTTMVRCRLQPKAASPAAAATGTPPCAA